MPNFSSTWGQGFFGQSYGQWTLFFVFWVVVWMLIQSATQMVRGRR